MFGPFLLLSVPLAKGPETGTFTAKSLSSVKSSDWSQNSDGPESITASLSGSSTVGLRHKLSYLKLTWGTVLQKYLPKESPNYLKLPPHTHTHTMVSCLLAPARVQEAGMAGIHSQPNDSITGNILC